jgi:hypothetical protein
VELRPCQLQSYPNCGHCFAGQNGPVPMMQLNGNSISCHIKACIYGQGDPNQPMVLGGGSVSCCKSVEQ